ncbi:gliding motility-associated C-terminal domain-containing protein [Aquimarina spongiae]|uniref:Gliding motility-associated C-terminal domain-containing protein n=1 Tax=Aquimarina spongiae TaxID=570521 RepID=A0A1M6CXL1_9FLAO|nr:gliding motility-associated C-terminal domain-containing protein [Aquimarina spongiae]SHI65690.1 gliding motility-associated C-terminal domain-containing protein [Aquimarina spongiae]
MKKKIQFKTRLKWGLFLLLGVIGMGIHGQTLIGEEILGFGHLGLGENTSISADGNTVAIGLWSPNWYAPNDPRHAHLWSQGVYGNNGSVRVFTKKVSSQGVAWEQVGDYIFPETLWEQHYYGQRSGRAISLSDDGSVIAIGARGNEGNGVGTDTGHVRVFQKVADTSSPGGYKWVQVGNDIDGTQAWSLSGFDVSLSGDGNVVAIGAPFFDVDDLSNAGLVRVYKRNVSDNWVQIGSDIEGQSGHERLGISVNLSDDGNTLAMTALNVGAGYRDEYNRLKWDSEGVITKVFKNDSNNWSLIGEFKGQEGTVTRDDRGVYVRLTGDGKTLAITSVIDQSVQVYERGADDNWTLKGNKLKGAFGYALSISDDAKTLAIGTPLRDFDRFLNVGAIRIYKYRPNNTWEVVGNFNGEHRGHELGNSNSVSLSADGSVIAIGASDYGYEVRDGTAWNLLWGRARMFNIGVSGVYIEGAPETINTTDPFEVTFKLDRAVFGFNEEDIKVTNATVSNFEAVSESKYSATITPAFICGDNDDITINVAASSAFDIDSNMPSLVAQEVVVKTGVVALAQDITVQVDPNGMVTISPADIDDGSSHNCQNRDPVTLSLDRDTFTCSDVGTPVTVTLTATSGNQTDTTTAVVTVENNINGPVAVTKDITIQLNADGIASINPGQIDNGSGSGCYNTTTPILLSVDKSTFSCDDVGEVIVTLTAAQGNNSHTATATVTVEENLDNLEVKAKDNIIVQLNDDGEFTISPEDVDEGSSYGCGHTPSLSLDRSTFTCADSRAPVTVTLTASHGDNSEVATVTVTVEGNCEPQLFTDLNRGFSPNGDGIADTLEIKGLEKYENNEVKIYNLNQQLLFSAHYNGPSDGWDGTYSGGRVPVGAYVCVIDYNEPGLTHQTKMIYVNY